MAKGFGGFPGGGNMQALLQQAQKMQRDMQVAQEQAEAFEAEGSVGGGAVKIRVNGKYEVLSVEIKPDAVDPSSVDLLQDMVKSAANDAIAKVRSNTDVMLSKVTGGMNIPGLS
jgi:DNA-binding YbaB/EbfC family protein